MSLTPEWRDRVTAFKRELNECIYRRLGNIEFEGFVTRDFITHGEAIKKSFKPVSPGTRWGAKWEYGWFRSRITLPEEAEGKRIQLDIDVGGEALVYINGVAAGGAFQGNAWRRDDSDFDKNQRVTLAKKARSGSTYEIVIEAYAGHGPQVGGGGPVAAHRESVPEPAEKQAEIRPCSYGIWNEDVYQLKVDVETLWEVRENIEQNSFRVQKIDSALKDFTNIFDPELPHEEMIKSAVRARDRLKESLSCANGPTTPEFFAFGHAHIDVAWLWPVEQTKRKTAITFANQLAIAEEYPEYRFLQSQPHLYMILKTHYPEIYKRVKEAVKKGNIVPEGGMWVEADTNISGGESLIRQFMHGKRFFKEEFGIDSELLWLPDVFGYSGALPQIVKGCGIKHFSTQKIFWTYHGGDSFPYIDFIWEGIDGSELPAHLHSDYNAFTSPGVVIRRWNERVQKDGVCAQLFPFGWGDGGGGPARKHMEFIRREKDLEGVPKMRMATPAEFFIDFERRKDPGMPRYIGELYLQAHRGTYTTQAKTKQGNRKSEFALREAELWATIASLTKKYSYPKEKIDSAWQTVLLNQFHDILPGSSINRVYKEAAADYAQVIKTTGSIADESAKALCAGGNAISAFNPLGWERTALIELPDSFKASGMQVLRGKKYAEINVPSCGYVSISPSENYKADEKDCRADENSMENDILKISFNSYGEITGIYDKDMSKELSRGRCNAMKMYKDVPSMFDAWDIDSMYKEAPVELADKAQVKALASGPLFAAIEVTRQLNNSKMKQEIWLQRGKRRIDFRTTIDWKEKHKLLKVEFPVNVLGDTAMHEIQFGHIRRPAHMSRQFDADRFEVSAHKWTAIEEENFGCAVLNDCKYGVNVSGNSINLTLLRAPIAPDMYADLGIQEFTYSFYAWHGSFAESRVIHEAYELNVPVRMVNGGIGESSFLSVNAQDIIIETIKTAEDDSGDIIVRLYESKRMSAKCVLSVNLPFTHVFETDMLENNPRNISNNGNEIPLSFRPFEIKTLRLKK